MRGQLLFSFLLHFGQSLGISLTPTVCVCARAQRVRVCVSILFCFSAFYFSFIHPFPDSSPSIPGLKASSHAVLLQLFSTPGCYSATRYDRRVLRLHANAALIWVPPALPLSPLK